MPIHTKRVKTADDEASNINSVVEDLSILILSCGSGSGAVSSPLL